MQTNELNLTCTQTILSYCFDFVLQGCLGDWDRAFERLPTYLFHRGSGQDVVQENWILKKNDFFLKKKKKKKKKHSSSKSSSLELRLDLILYERGT